MGHPRKPPPSVDFATIIGDTEEYVGIACCKPDEVDNSSPGRPVWVNYKKTFDVDNYSKAGDRVLVYTKKGADGKLVGQDTNFQ